MNSRFPFGIPEADIPVLLQLSDQELGRTCSSSPYLNRLCKDDYFWRLRLQHRYPYLLHLSSKFPNYYEFYQYARNQAYDVQYGVDTPKLYNDIRAAYQEIARWLSLVGMTQIPPIERADELGVFLGNSRFPLKIYMLQLGEISWGDPQHLLIDLSASPIVVAPELDKMLTFEPNILVTYTLDNPSMIGMAQLSNQSMEDLSQLSREQRLAEDMFTLQRTDNQYTLEFMYVASDTFVAMNVIIPIVIAKVNGRFMVTLIPQQYHSQIRGPASRILRDEYLRRPTREGEMFVPIYPSDVRDFLPRIFNQLSWEPLESLLRMINQIQSIRLQV